MNATPRIDHVTIVTAGTPTTTIAGGTASLLVIQPEDFEEIRFVLPIAQITGSPIFTVSHSDDGTNYTAETNGVFTRSSADNAKVLVIGVQHCRHPYYKLALNLNSGTVNFAISNNGVTGEKVNPRKLPLPAGTTVPLVFTADN